MQKNRKYGKIYIKNGKEGDLQDFAHTALPTATCLLALQTLYIVDVGPEYDVFRRCEDYGRVEIFRTIQGEGGLILSDGTEEQLTAGSLIAVATEQLLRYRCSGGRWSFLWFAFFHKDGLPFRINTLYRIPDAGGDLQTARRLLVRLNSVRSADRAAASAGFSSLLYDWNRRSEGGAMPGPDDSFIRLATELKRSFRERMPVGRMAAFCGMSERSFRQKFRAWAGEAPLRYYRRLAAEAAASFLENSAETMQSVSERFGYSSPFHMCTEFKKIFGKSPKHFRNAAR